MRVNLYDERDVRIASAPLDQFRADNADDPEVLHAVMMCECVLNAVNYRAASYTLGGGAAPPCRVEVTR